MARLVAAELVRDPLAIADRAKVNAQQAKLPAHPGRIGRYWMPRVDRVGSQVQP